MSSPEMDNDHTLVTASPHLAPAAQSMREIGFRVH
jgi:hypothetical protein